MSCRRILHPQVEVAVSRLVEIEAFVAVAEEGSFTGAAAKLSVSSSYVSKLVSRLEERLDVRLLHRTTRKLTMTNAGERFFEGCGRALVLVGDAVNDITDSEGGSQGRLRLTVPTGLGLSALSGVIASFASANPALTMEVVYLDRYVDLVEEGFDLALRAGTLPDSSLVARKLVTAKRLLVCSPDYLARAGAPERPEDLGAHPCIVHTNARAPITWTLRRGKATKRVRVSGRFFSNSGRGMADAASRGVGFTYTPEFHVADDLIAGRLVHVLEEWGDEVPIYAVLPSARHVPASVRALTDQFASHFLQRPSRT
jgi:DNA-binding transcriptional LysR family regulator